MINLGIAGYGEIGKRIFDLLINEKDINILSVVSKDIEINKNQAVFSKSIESIINNKNIELVIESISDLNTARDLVIQSIQNKKSIITSNSELMYHYGKTICKLAKENNVTVYLNGMVSSAIPEKKIDAVSLTNKNFHNYAGFELFMFRGATRDMISEDMKNDVYRFLSDYKS